MNTSYEQITTIMPPVDISSCYRDQIKEGMRVSIGRGKDDAQSLWINGTVEEILTPVDKKYSEDGIKVRITDGTIGYVKEILHKLDEKELKQMIQGGENKYVEFKETFKVDADSKKELKCLRDEVVKEIVAFMNTGGGYLIIGVKDSKKIVGLSLDYLFIEPSRDNQPVEDKFEQEIRNYVRQNLKNEILEPKYNILFKTVDEKQICVIAVERSSIPVFAEQQIQYLKCGNTNITKGHRQNFYIRTGAGTCLVDARKLLEFWKDRASGKIGGFQ